MKQTQKRCVPVMVTAPESYASRFTQALARVGDDDFEFEPVCMPLVTTMLSDEVEGVLDGDYDYLVFTSRRAITSLAEVMRERQMAVGIPAEARCCAIGRDNDALAQLGDVRRAMADEPSLMGIAQMLEASHRPGERAAVRVAVLGPRVERLTEPDTVPDFLKALDTMGFQVTYHVAYVTALASGTVLQQAAEMVKQRQVEWVAFTSATEAEAFHIMMDSTRVEGVRLACFGPYTEKCVRKQGFDVAFTSPDFSSFDAFAQHLKCHIVD